MHDINCSGSNRSGLFLQANRKGGGKNVHVKSVHKWIQVCETELWSGSARRLCPIMIRRGQLRATWRAHKRFVLP